MDSLSGIEDNVQKNLNPSNIINKTVETLNPVQILNNLEGSLISEFRNLEDTFSTDINKVEDTFSGIKDGVINGFDHVGKFFTDFEHKAENFYSEDIKPIGSALFNIAVAGVKVSEFLLIHYKLTLGVVGAYLTFRFVNEAKQALN